MRGYGMKWVDSLRKEAESVASRRVGAEATPARACGISAAGKPQGASPAAAQLRWLDTPVCALAALLLAALCLGLAGCAEGAGASGAVSGGGSTEAATASVAGGSSAATSAAGAVAPVAPDGRITADNVPAYAGEASVAVNGGVPGFTQEDLARGTFEDYAPLDSLGRCGMAFALVSDETRPANGEKRGNISAIKPTGWVQGRYEDLPDGSLYNRSHLIAWSLGAENDNPRNLITGTSFMNQGTMQGVENRILAYIRNTGNHVLVRVTPVFVGDELLARGVQYEALSIEDGGQAVCVNEFMFNVQPGIRLDYATGLNERAVEGEDTGSTVESLPVETAAGVGDDASAAAGAIAGAAAGDAAAVQGAGAVQEAAPAAQNDYVLNTNTRKVHRPGCSSVQKMKAKNRSDYSGALDELLAQGYSPCQICRPE